MRLLMSIISREKRALPWPRATMSNALQQRHAGLQHRRELAREERDVLLGDLLAAAERLPLELGDADALAAQVGRDDGLGRGLDLAAHLAVAAVEPFPDERVFADLRAVLALRRWWRWPWSVLRVFAADALTRW